FDRSLGDVKLVLCPHENIVPEPRLQVAFHLGQVVIWAGTSFKQRSDVVEEGQAEVKDACRDRLAIDPHMLFKEMPATRAYHQRGNLLVKSIIFALRANVADSAVDGIAQIDLSLNCRFP